jgi:hypothetical protein
MSTLYSWQAHAGKSHFTCCQFFTFTKTPFRKTCTLACKIQEHDLTIKISKTIKGWDIALHLAQHPEPSVSSENDENVLSTLFFIDNQNLVLVKHPWYKDLIYYLEFQKCHYYFESHQCRRLCLKASKYLILGNSLFCISIDGMLFVAQLIPQYKKF